ncbi:MAG: ribonuclease HII, partial [Elusimicrobia bacterium]|nr:ribonuclease HII [Elusimicrobiota bacterium]
MPKDNIELKLRRCSFKYIVGVDEAGRGPLAGPVVAVAVLIKFKIQNATLPAGRQECKIATKSCAATSLLCAIQDSKLANSKLQIQDSKKLSARKREEVFEALKNHPKILWGKGMVSAKVIDRINIWEATKLATKRAIKNLEKKTGKRLPKKKTLVIVDGNLKIESGYFEASIIKADQKIPECILASIFAKVIRDRLM